MRWHSEYLVATQIDLVVDPPHIVRMSPEERNPLETFLGADDDSSRRARTDGRRTRQSPYADGRDKQDAGGGKAADADTGSWH